MVDEIARLGVAVDSTSALGASKDLEALAAAGDKAQRSADGLKNSWDKNTFSTGNIMRANWSLAKYRKENAQAAQEAQAQAQAAIADAARVASANKVVAASHHQVAKAAVGYTKSAKEMAFATRNLPAQFTDIAVSLQAGQNPLTVLLQQGGQLKDMFGGIGPAAKALGGYILGLINPYVLAAAAVAVLGTAFIKGENEALRLNRALASTGGQAGVTSDQILAMSEAMDRGKISQSNAVSGLEEVAKNGKIAGAAFQLVATAAVNMNRVTGKEISETVEEFAALGKDPVNAVLKLNETHQFLTASVYEQIKALAEQGNEAQAARVAQEAYADAVNTRAAEMESQLGSLQWAWSKVKVGAKAAWDAMMDIGRPESGASKFNEMHVNLQRLQETAAAYGPGKSPEWLNQRINSIREDMRKLGDANVQAQKEASRVALKAEADLYAVELDQQALNYSKNSEKRVKLVAAAEKKYSDAVFRERQLGGADLAARLARLAADQQTVMSGINDRYKDPKPKAAKKSDAARDAERYLREQAQEYDRFNKSLRDHEATLREAAESQDKLTSYEKWAAKAIAEMESEESKLTRTQKEAIKAKMEMVRALDRESQERERSNRIMRNTADLVRDLAAEEAAQTRSINQESLSVGRGQNEAQLEMALEEIRYRMMERRTEVEERHRETRSIGSKEYLADLARINDAEARVSAAEIGRLEKRKEAMGDWRNGARSAMEDIAWEMSDTAGQTRDSFMTMFSAMNNALTEFATTGKVRIRDFATVVIAELLRIALTIAASKILMSILGTGDSGYEGGPTAGPSMANGGVSSGGRIVPFAMGGVNGTVRTGSTLFPLASGGQALVAEERPEAILPLQRGPNGKLGVAAQGGGGSVYNISTVVNIDSNGNASSKSDGAENSEDGRKLADLINVRVREVLVQERRQGGLLWGMANGR